MGVAPTDLETAINSINRDRISLVMAMGQNWQSRDFWGDPTLGTQQVSSTNITGFTSHNDRHTELSINSITSGKAQKMAPPKPCRRATCNGRSFPGSCCWTWAIPGSTTTKWRTSPSWTVWPPGRWFHGFNGWIMVFHRGFSSWWHQWFFWWLILGLILGLISVNSG